MRMCVTHRWGDAVWGDACFGEGSGDQAGVSPGPSSILLVLSTPRPGRSERPCCQPRESARSFLGICQGGTDPPNEDGQCESFVKENLRPVPHPSAGSPHGGVSSHHLTTVCIRSFRDPWIRTTNIFLCSLISNKECPQMEKKGGGALLMLLGRGKNDWFLFVSLTKFLVSVFSSFFSYRISLFRILCEASSLCKCRSLACKNLTQV